MDNEKLNLGYKKRGETHELWKWKAEDLAKAAVALWNSELHHEMPTHGRSSMVLMGLSLENLLKGILFKSGKCSIEEGKLPRSVKTHNLNELCREAGVKIEDTYEEKTFLQRLSEQVDWAGKYPIPTQATILRNSKYGSRKAFVGNLNDMKFFEDIYNKIVFEFDK